MSKYIVAFNNGLKTETIEADHYQWSVGGWPITFTDLAKCEHEQSVVVAQFESNIVRSIRIAE